MNHPDSTKRRLIALLQRLAPDVAQKLWRVDDVRDLPREEREVIVDVLGCECAERGFDEDDELNAYGVELEKLIEGVELGETSE
jgi:hypothetical protein